MYRPTDTYTHTHAHADTTNMAAHNMTSCNVVCSSLSEHNLNKDLSELHKKLNKLKRDNQKLETDQNKLEAEVSPTI